jgi:hypothetical protein
MMKSLQIELLAETTEHLPAKEVVAKPAADPWCREVSSLKRFAGTRRPVRLGSPTRWGRVLGTLSRGAAVVVMPAVATRQTFSVASPLAVEPTRN